MNKTKENKPKKKRKNERDYILIDGMKIDGDILLHVDRPMRDHSGLLLVIISIIASFSTMFLGLTYFDTGANNALVSISIIILCLSFALVRSEESFIRFIGLFIIGAHILSFAMFYQKIANGFIILYSEYMRKANRPNSVLSAMIEDIPRSEYDTDVNMFVILVTLIICFGMVFSCLYKINLPAMVLFSFPLFELGAYWGWKPSTLCFLLLLICWTTIFALQLVNYSANKAGIRNTFAIHPRKKTFYFTSDKLKKGFFTKYIYSMFIICICIVLLLYTIVSAIGKDRPDKMLDARKDLSNFIEDLSYRGLTNTLSDLNDTLFNNANIGGTNGGKLGKVDKISFNGSTALEVVIDDFNTPMYFKGFVAGEYKDNSWIEIDPEDRLDDFADEYEGYIQDIGYNKITRMAQYDGLDYPPSEFSVKVKGASKKYAYAPYFTSYASDNNSGDDRCKPTKEGHVSLRARKYLMNYYNLSKKADFDDFNSNQALGLLSVCDNAKFLRDVFETKYEYDYYQYVIDTYLDVTGSDGLKEAVNTINTSYIGINNYQAVYENGSADYSSYINVINAIEKYFDDNFKYTLSPGSTPSDEDFIDYFISEQKEGYCSYFASAGVMLLRHYGIPARYVEGYIIHPNMKTEHNENGMNEIDVLDKSAHAWAEIYTRELGWIPVEFTPGYDEDNPNIDNKNDKKDTQTTTTTTVTTTTTAQKITTSKSTNNSKTTETTTTKASGSGGEKSTTTKKSVETKNSETDEDSDTDGNGGGFVGPFGGGKGGSSTGMIVLYVGIILLLITVIIVRRSYNLRKLRSSINSQNDSKAVRSCYNASLKYLSLMGIKESENQSDYKDLAAIIEKMKKSGYSEESSSDFEFLSENAILAYFSKDDPDKDMSSRCRAALSTIRKETSKLLNPIEKLGAVIISNLY